MNLCCISTRHINWYCLKCMHTLTDWAACLYRASDSVPYQPPFWFTQHNSWCVGWTWWLVLLPKGLRGCHTNTVLNTDWLNSWEQVFRLWFNIVCRNCKNSQIVSVQSHFAAALHWHTVQMYTDGSGAHSVNLVSASSWVVLNDLCWPCNLTLIQEHIGAEFNDFTTVMCEG